MIYDDLKDALKAARFYIYIDEYGFESIKINGEAFRPHCLGLKDPKFKKALDDYEYKMLKALAVIRSYTGEQK